MLLLHLTFLAFFCSQESKYADIFNDPTVLTSLKQAFDRSMKTHDTKYEADCRNRKQNKRGKEGTRADVDVRGLDAGEWGEEVEGGNATHERTTPRTSIPENVFVETNEFYSPRMPQKMSSSKRSAGGRQGNDKRDAFYRGASEESAGGFGRSTFSPPPAMGPLPSFASARSPRVPPMPVGIDGEDKELANLLMAWYYSGYYTGQYKARQQMRRELFLQKDKRGAGRGHHKRP